MKYFLDTEFHEYKKKPLFGKPIDTIELISIGIVSEDTYNTGSGKDGKDIYTINPDREYYAICKDFGVKAAWNSFQWEDHTPTHAEDRGKKLKRKVYWLRENVLYPIFRELLIKDGKEFDNTGYGTKEMCARWDFKDFKRLINKYGNSREVIAEEIKEFIVETESPEIHPEDLYYKKDKLISIYKPEFYAYYADYDWVVFCWLFGRMIDLPNGFPYYCKDLQQTKAEHQVIVNKSRDKLVSRGEKYFTCKLEDFGKYPKQTNEHNALADAKWNKELYNFLNTL